MGIKGLFTVPEGEKVTEKHLYRVLISSICCIVLCMVCLVSTTWAWYTTTIVSEGNVIEIGDFQVKVEIDPAVSTALDSNSGFVFNTVGDYTVTITNEGSTSGYCGVSFDGYFDGYEEFKTVTIGSGKSVSFEVKVNGTAVDLRMDITNHWGSSPGSTMPDDPLSFGTEITEPETEPSTQESTGTDQESGGDETPTDETTASQPEVDTPETTETTTAPSENIQSDGNN